jgi:hypothetical protein
MARTRHARPPRGEAYRHTYSGPTTRYGLLSGAACAIVGGKAGGRLIRTRDGKTWLVGRDEVVLAK